MNEQAYRVLAIRPGRWMTIADIVSQLKRNVSAVYRAKVRQELMALADAGYLEWQDGLHFGRFRHTEDCNQLIAIATGASVRYARHALEIAEIQQHIAAGKRPKKLDLAWGERAFFVLTEGLQIKKLAFADLVFENKGNSEDEFDADVALTTGELELLLPELVQALGGEMGQP